MDEEWDEILSQLEKDLKSFIKNYSRLSHILYDSFLDHRNRYKNDLKILNKNFKGGKVLDIGASPFHLMYCLKKLGVDVVGVDIDINKFKTFIDKHGLSIKKCDIERQKLPFQDNTFDFIIFNEVFEHLRVNPIFTLKEINRVLKLGGILMLTTPNLYAIHKILMFNFGKSFNDAYDEFYKLNVYGYMGHIREYSTKEIKKFLEKTNFKILKISYQNHYSFYKDSYFKNVFLKLIGLLIDLLMVINPYWRRHQAFIATKI